MSDDMHSQKENIKWFDKSPAHDLCVITKENTADRVGQIEFTLTRAVCNICTLKTDILFENGDPIPN